MRYLHGVKASYKSDDTKATFTDVLAECEVVERGGKWYAKDAPPEAPAEAKVVVPQALGNADEAALIAALGEDAVAALKALTAQAKPIQRVEVSAPTEEDEQEVSERE